ncbi:MAG: class I SAM-dependent methyltransferase [Polyangiaceae bacterium]
MGNDFKGRREHSAEHFGDARDHWWNRDFVALMAERWKLEAVRDVLDVGCGIGHWGMLLETVLPRDARVTGVDREASWVDKAKERARSRGLGERFSYQRADAQRLPFPDDTFDLVTCQTVLIHMADPASVVTEMKRVTRPGGLVAVAEPNNLTESLLLDSITSQASTGDIVELVRFQLTCERGKISLGEGDNSLGDRVPGIFVAQGLSDVAVFVNDKATAMFPPYDAPAQRAAVDDLRDQVTRERWNWSEDEAKRLFLAGGGALPDFSAHYARGLAARGLIVGGIDDRAYHGIIGGAFYLVSGRK